MDKSIEAAAEALRPILGWPIDECRVAARAAIAAYRDAEIERLTAENDRNLQLLKGYAVETGELRAKLEAATLMAEVAEQQLDWLIRESRKADLHFMLPDWNGDYGCLREAIDSARGGEHG